MTPRLSHRGQRLLAVGLVLCSLILVAGGLWWFTRSESVPAALSNARTVKLFVTQPGMVAGYGRRSARDWVGRQGSVGIARDV